MDKTTSICPFCSLGCGLNLLVSDGVVTGIEYLGEHPNEGALCSRGNTCYEVAQHPDRIPNPLIKEGEGFRDATWDEALKLIASKLSEIKSKYGAKSIGVIASAKTSNEDCYVLQKFARKVLETPNIDNPARVTQAPTLKVLVESLGYPWATCLLEDLEKADYILMVGANPIETQPVLARRILRARDEGAVVVVVDPRRSKSTWKSDLHLQVKPGFDLELIMSMLNVVLQSKLEKEDARRTPGFEEVAKLAENYTPEGVEELTGVSAKLVREAAYRLALSKRPFILFSHGLTQQRRGADALRALLALAVAVGVFSSGGLIPLTDQNNMQGSCDMGCLADYGAGYTSVEKGLTLAEIIEAAARGELKALIVVGFNPAASLPDTKLVEEALSKLELLVVVDIFPSETTKLAHVVLPACSWAEYEGTYTNIEGRVQKSGKAIDPFNDAKPVWTIFSELATIMGASGFNYSSWIDVFNEITSTVSHYSNLTVEEVSKVGGKLVKAREAKPEVKLSPPSSRSPEGSEGFTLIAGRAPFHLGSGNMTRRLSFASKQLPEAYLEVSGEDASKMGLSEGDVVEVKGPRGSLKVKVKVSPKGLPGTLFMPIHFPDCSPLSLMKLEVDDETKAPLSKHIPVEISKEG